MLRKACAFLKEEEAHYSPYCLLSLLLSCVLQHEALRMDGMTCFTGTVLVNLGRELHIIVCYRYSLLLCVSTVNGKAVPSCVGLPHVLLLLQCLLKLVRIYLS